MKKIKLIAIYQVLMPYRVGVYERLGQNKNYRFELLHGRSKSNTKLQNFCGEVGFKKTQLASIFLGVSTNNGDSFQQFMPGLLFSLLKRNPDVILSEGASGLFNASIAFIYAKLFRKKYIWWSLGKLQGREHKGLRSMVDKWIHYIEKHSNAIFTYSTQGANHFIEARGIHRERVFTAVNVIDTDQKLRYISQLQVRRTQEFHITFVGAIIKVKNLEVLVDAFDQLSKRFDNIYLDIIGDGNYLPTLREYIADKNNKRIKIHGRRTGIELSQILIDSSVLVLPGLGGLAICDGMLHSLPIISGVADGTELDLIDESCGFVTNEMTVDFLKEKLSLLIENPALAKKMGKESFQRITRRFSISNYMDVLNKCISFSLNN